MEQERQRLAELIECDAELIAAFACDKRSAVELVALLVRHAGEGQVAAREDRLEVG